MSQNVTMDLITALKVVVEALAEIRGMMAAAAEEILSRVAEDRDRALGGMAETVEALEAAEVVMEVAEGQLKAIITKVTATTPDTPTPTTPDVDTAITALEETAKETENKFRDATTCPPDKWKDFE